MTHHPLQIDPRSEVKPRTITKGAQWEATHFVSTFFFTFLLVLVSLVLLSLIFIFTTH